MIAFSMSSALEHTSTHTHMHTRTHMLARAIREAQRKQVAVPMRHRQSTWLRHTVQGQSTWLRHRQSTWQARRQHAGKTSRGHVAPRAAGLERSGAAQSWLCMRGGVLLLRVDLSNGLISMVDADLMPTDATCAQAGRSRHNQELSETARAPVTARALLADLHLPCTSHASLMARSKTGSQSWRTRRWRTRLSARALPARLAPAKPAIHPAPASPVLPRPRA
jgi:hypothetical protein